MPQTRRAPANGAKPEEDRTPTRRLVLRRERAIVVPDSVSSEELANMDESKLRKLLGASVREAWVVVDEQAGATMRAAIEKHAGKAGTPDARPGVYKAPPLRGWEGGEVYEKPPEPKVERKALVD